MSGQDGFVATDALPPFAGPGFAKADVDDLGIEMCMKVWQRIQKPLHGIPLDEYLAKSRRRSILPPNDRIRELVKAGALIAAEIDRLAVLSSEDATRPTGDKE